MTVGLLHHIELYVSDLKKSAKFWGWLLESLGYEKFQEWDEGKSWKLGDTYIVFVQTEEKYLDPPYHRKRVGLNHLAFHAKSATHIDEMTEAFKQKQVPILYKATHPYAGGEGYYAVYVEDPDRIKVELVAPESRVLNHDK
ncbi:VOC family protein [Shouchella sp. 1P09AA]|uniref:VOC family protein n=1 Tax=unclassified Shouchella TaxID=2893065 RepID=UPI0039A33750